MTDGNSFNRKVLAPGPPLSSADTLTLFLDAVSPAGTRRIHRSAAGVCLILNERGGTGRIHRPPASTYWQQINHPGQAIALVSQYHPAANGVPGYTSFAIQLGENGSSSGAAWPRITRETDRAG